MPRRRSKITAQGRLSVPAEREDGGRVIVRRATRYSSEDIHRAVFAHPPKPRSFAELKEGIADFMRKKHGRR